MKVKKEKKMVLVSANELRILVFDAARVGIQYSKPEKKLRSIKKKEVPNV